jgi:hypothetical protein
MNQTRKKNSSNGEICPRFDLPTNSSGVQNSGPPKLQAKKENEDLKTAGSQPREGWQKTATLDTGKLLAATISLFFRIMFSSKEILCAKL